MSAKVSKCKRAYTFADTPGGGGVGRWCVFVCAHGASGFEVRRKVHQFRDFRRSGTNTETHICIPAPARTLRPNASSPNKTVPRQGRPGSPARDTGEDLSQLPVLRRTCKKQTSQQTKNNVKKKEKSPNHLAGEETAL